MDRRKLQIQKNVDEICEEKELMQSYLDKIMNHVHSCVDYINTAPHLKQKDCTLILNYELGVLKKIIEINCELESILDESPLNQIVTNGIGESNIKINPIDLKLEIVRKKEVETPETILNIVENQDISAPEPNYDHVVSSSMQGTESVTCDERRETQGHFSDADIQVIRDALKQSIRYCSRTAELFDKPSTSEAAQSSINSSNLVFDKSRSEEFDIPEKDTNTTNLENHVEIVPGVESSISFNEEDTENKIYSIDDSSSTVSSANAIETGSNEEYVNDKAPHCLIPLVDENSIVVDHIIDEDNFMTDDNTESRKTTCTALEKLNNMIIQDRQAEAVAQLQVVSPPDISLKPTEHRIKNNLELNDKKSKKQRKKKNKNKEFHELVPKATPKADTLCAFSHVESPSEFYIHLVDEESAQIDSMTEQLNAQFGGTLSEYASKEEAFNSIGRFCIAYLITFKSWYRGEVLNWELESKSEDVLVHFVDYGNKRRVSYRNLRWMSKEMSEIPTLAIRCHLPLLYPPKSTRENRLTEWPMATIDALMELSGLLGQNESEREKFFRIVYASQEDQSLSVDMHNLRDDEENTVGQILLDLGLAQQITDEREADHPELEEFLQDVDYLERADNVNEAVMGYDPRDELRICRFTKSDGTCFKGKNCKLEHVPLSKDGFTTDQMLIFNEAMYSLTLPTNGSYMNILITWYTDVCNFFAQMIWRPRKEKGYMIDNDLYMLLADMNHAKTVRTYEAFKMPPAHGEIVIVKHSSNKFLRAKVREQIEGASEHLTKYKVFTLDFGEYLTVPLDSLRKIKPHFLELPFQAVECYLHNYVARVDGDRKKARNFFFNNMYYRNFVAEVMSTSLPLRLAVSTFDRRDIGNMLAKEGLAKERVCDKNPAKGCKLELY